MYIQTACGKIQAPLFWTVQNRSFYSKCYPTVEEAAVARKELERLHWGAA